MGKNLKITPVKGGWVKRDASTGEFRQVHSGDGTFKATSKSGISIEVISSRRSAALKRLANR